MLPSRNHAIVLVSKVHKPTLRALAYARATRPTRSRRSPSTSTRRRPARCRREWDRRGIPVPLKVLDSPYREITGPVIDYVRSVRRGSPRDVVTVLIPEYVVGHWWEHLLHNQSALRLKGRLLFTPGVMVTSVPWQLQSSEGLADRRRGRAAGRVPARRRRPRRGAVLSADARSGCPRSAGRSRSRSGRSRTAGTAWPGTRAGCVFVRHALPGERVRVVVTDGHDGSPYWRADAVEVARAVAGPGRAAVPVAGPGRCGGCDWQHASLPAQRALKAAVVQRAAAPAGRARPSTSRSRRCRATRTGWAGAPGCSSPSTTTGTPGLHRHRSHEVVPVDRCRIAHPLVDEADVTGRRWPGHASVEVAVSPSTGERLVLPDGRGHGRARPRSVGGRGRSASPAAGSGRCTPGRPRRCWTPSCDGLDPQPGESALDLYCGVGLFAAALAARVGPTGRVTAVESDRVAVEDARHNLRDLPAVRIERGRVDHVLRRLRLGRADLVVLDPPRSGAGRAVVDLLSRVRARRIAYVACDPAALARDLRCFGERGYRLVRPAGLRPVPDDRSTSSAWPCWSLGAADRRAGCAVTCRVLVCVLCTKPRSPCPPS